MIDLANSFSDEPPPVDTSGKPLPKNVRAILDSGLEIPCVLKYVGVVESAGAQCRKYMVMAEVNWGKHWVKTLVIGEWPSDVQLAFDAGPPTAQWLESEAYQYRNQMDVVIEKRISV